MKDFISDLLFAAGSALIIVSSLVIVFADQAVALVR